MGTPKRNRKNSLVTRLTSEALAEKARLRMAAGQPPPEATRPDPEEALPTMVPRRPPDENTVSGTFEKNVLTSTGQPDGVRHVPLERGVARRLFLRWNVRNPEAGIGMA